MTQPAERDPSLMLWLIGEISRWVKTAEQPYQLAETVVDGLTAAGRILPDGPETRTEHEIEWKREDRARGGVESIGYWDLDEAQLDKEIESARRFGCYMVGHRRRTHRKWPDGTTLTGPWIEEPA